jgi:hypothetical protein
MPILHAEIQVAGRQAPFVAGSFSFWQITDYAGRPSTDVRLGLIELTLTGDAAASVFWEEWMLDPYRRQSGRLVFFENEDQKAKTVVFYDAFCVHYECRFDARGQDGHGSFEIELNLSAAAKEVQGQFSEAHSVIPWAADPATRYRALTKPAEYLPSASLAAYQASTTANAAPTVPDGPPPSLPGAAPSAVRYLTKKMEPQYEGEETGAVWGTKVKYLSADERKAYELTVGPDGLLRDANQQLFDTTGAYTADGPGKAVFVMSEAGTLYASLEHKPGKFHHSSFLAGQPVAAAGELVATQGVVTQISNHSGHYKPEEEFTHQVTEHLWRQGAKDTDKINIISFDH